jgi:hypothetical protein
MNDGILTGPLVYRPKERASNVAPFMYIASELVHDELLGTLGKIFRPLRIFGHTLLVYTSHGNLIYVFNALTNDEDACHQIKL